ncbi:hypothetical protein D9M69_600440 [compost metagenome]
MPEFKCEHGHTIHVGTDAWIATLNLDQLRYAREKADEIIKKAEEAPRRTVWLVAMSGWNEGWYREDEYEKAADHLLRIFKDRFTQEAKDFLEEPFGASRFADEIPRIIPFRCTQHEYDTEWFPQK